MKLKLKAFLLSACLTALFTMQSVSARLISDDFVLDLGAPNGVFVNTAPIISLNITNSESTGKNFTLEYTVTNRDGNFAEDKTVSFSVPARTATVKQIKPTSDYGSYIFEAKLSSDGMSVTKKQYYAVIPEISKKNDFLGLCTHFITGTRENAYEAFPQLDKSGAGWIREDLLWRECEYAAGKYKIPDRFAEAADYAESHGIKVLAILNAGNKLYDDGSFPTSKEGLKAYGEFCKYAANQLKDKVDAFEIWNEPDLGNYKENRPTPAQYTRLLKTAYEAIKSVNPDATVAGGALTAMKAIYGAEDFLKGMLSAGAHNYMDVFSFHPYVHGRYYPDEYSGKSVFDNIETVEYWLNQAGATNMPIWLTEVGYYDDGGTQYRTEDDQAAALARMGAYFRHNSRIERIFVYNYKEKGTDVTEPEHKFGIVSYYYYPKPAYASLAFVNKLLAGAEPTEYKRTDYGAAYGLTNQYGEDIFSVWAARGRINSAGDASKTVTLKVVRGNTASAELTAKDDVFTVKIPTEKEIVIYDMYGNVVEDNIGTYTVTHEPMYAVARPKAGIAADNTGNVIITGYAAPNSFVTMTARDGKSAFGKCAYIQQTVSDSEGRYRFEYALKSGDVYVISVYDGILTEERLNLGGYDVNCSMFDKAGNELSDINSLFRADDIRIKVRFDGTAGIPDVYAAAYNADGKIITVSAPTEKISDNEIEFDVNGISNASKFKIMLWKDGLKPLCQNIDVE